MLFRSPSGCEGKRGVALESLQGRRDLIGVQYWVNLHHRNRLIIQTRSQPHWLLSICQHFTGASLGWCQREMVIFSHPFIVPALTERPVIDIQKPGSDSRRMQSVASANISCMAWRAIPGPLSKRKRRLDSLEAPQGAPRDPSL